MDSYKISILDKNTNQFRDASDLFEEDTNTADLWGKQIECSALLGASTFGYAKGDKITFRVAATNSFGDSEWAYPEFAVASATTFSLLLL